MIIFVIIGSFGFMDGHHYEVLGVFESKELAEDGVVKYEKFISEMKAIPNPLLKYFSIEHVEEFENDFDERDNLDEEKRHQYFAWKLGLDNFRDYNSSAIEEHELNNLKINPPEWLINQLK